MTIPLRSEKPPKFEVNSSGQTFGSIKDVESIEDMPLLIRAVGDHGIEGYIYKNDLIDVENEPASPEEAIRMQEEKEADPDFKRVINVYDSEGKKILDTLTSG